MHDAVFVNNLKMQTYAQTSKQENHYETKQLTMGCGCNRSQSQKAITHSLFPVHTIHAHFRS